MGCQERGGPPPPARHVVGVVAIVSPPESSHLEADQFSEEPVYGVEVEALVSSSESVHPEAGPSSEKGKSLGRMTQDRALKHRAPSLRRALRVYPSLTFVMVVEVNELLDE